MKRFTFQIGSTYEAKPRVEPWFETALDSIRNAIAGPTPAMVAVRKIRRNPTRFEARLRTLSN